MMRLAGRTAIVMGVESPAGTAIARALAKAGATLHLVSADRPRVEALAAGLDASLLATDDEGPAAPDLVVDASALPAMPDRMTSEEDWEETFIRANRPVARLAARADRMPDKGAILLVTAVPAAVETGGWLMPMLAWREAAVAALARETAARGLRVNGLAPVMDAGGGLPGFLQPAAARPRAGTAAPVEVAEAALWLLGAGMATGLTLALDGGRRLQA
ncbi:SDR family oxidoreductase [Rubellimicrobium roseum]|uniref:SDR family oxidoreductase n=1 Tax=Rubellimicrobium roseum TaxID=687525 RepID=A0A5C4NJF1_9RHOB|nr:SDR family oxidoreductase [Rubellimicrobium roseum]TNC74914.1 SDR family oxidoreductase [Rubellimicrobium roseum]